MAGTKRGNTTDTTTTDPAATTEPTATTEPAPEPTPEPAPEPAPEPTPEPTPEPAPAAEPTGAVVEAPTAESTEFAPILYAPGYISCSAHHGLNSVTVNWTAPNEGEAESYTVELVGIMEMEVPAGTRSVQIDGLVPGSSVTASVTARLEGSTGTLTAPAVVVAEYDPANDNPTPA